MASRSTILYVGGLPYQWSVENIKSVVKGSGKLVDVRIKMDPSGRNKGFCFLEYLTPDDAVHALGLLEKVKIGGKKLRIELSKEALKNSGSQQYRQVLDLTRDNLPPDVKLPSALLADDGPGAGGNGSRAHSNTPTGSGPNYGAGRNNSPFARDATMPEHLLAAATKLPPLNPSCFDTESKVSQNLAAIPPNQIIQLIANLKNLLINNDFNSAASILNLSPQLTIAIAQALLLMGFVDNDVITQAASASAGIPNNNINASNNNNYNQQQQFPQNNGTPPMNQPVPQQFANRTPSAPPPNNPIPASVNANSNVPHAWTALPQHTVGKLLQMDRNQANVIAQVLLIPQDQLASLPNDQRVAIAQIRSQYL